MFVWTNHATFVRMISCNEHCEHIDAIKLFPLSYCCMIGDKYSSWSISMLISYQELKFFAFYTSHFSCSYHAACHAHEHILNINHAACLSFFLSCNTKRWYLINFPINYENRIYFLPISILSCRFFTCYGGLFYYHAQFRFIMRFILFELTPAWLWQWTSFISPLEMTTEVKSVLI